MDNQDLKNIKEAFTKLSDWFTEFARVVIDTLNAIVKKCKPIIDTIIRNKQNYDLSKGKINKHSPSQSWMLQYHKANAKPRKGYNYGTKNRIFYTKR